MPRIQVAWIYATGAHWDMEVPEDCTVGGLLDFLYDEWTTETGLPPDYRRFFCAKVQHHGEMSCEDLSEQHVIVAEEEEEDEMQSVILLDFSHPDLQRSLSERCQKLQEEFELAEEEVEEDEQVRDGAGNVLNQDYQQDMSLTEDEELVLQQEYSSGEQLKNRNQQDSTYQQEEIRLDDIQFDTPEMEIDDVPEQPADQVQPEQQAEDEVQPGQEQEDVQETEQAQQQQADVPARVLRLRPRNPQRRQSEQAVANNNVGIGSRKDGGWVSWEVDQFLDGLETYGKRWSKIAESYCNQRNQVQIKDKYRVVYKQMRNHWNHKDTLTHQQQIRFEEIARTRGYI
eukprot:TRINITY_DN2976_c0_g2_i1.p1 TRINITY_DN2976_c0_g2~~TRINITY_DN2976_c0_g2_i1.p1  ORF type:complete len:342 (-),score=54.72 TRINITY_DN2976_c0_g2_i1:571-1596(-)